MNLRTAFSHFQPRQFGPTSHAIPAELSRNESAYSASAAASTAAAAAAATTAAAGYMTNSAAIVVLRVHPGEHEHTTVVTGITTPTQKSSIHNNTLHNFMASKTMN